MAIYYLEVDDEITSAAARIRDSSDNRIALVLPGGSRVATSRINFRLLAREARRRNKRLAIIAADPSVQSVAKSAELPVYSTVGEYERAEAAIARGLHGQSANETSDSRDELAMTAGPAAMAGQAGRTGAVRVQDGPSTHGATGRIRISRPLLAAMAALLVLAVAAAGFFFYPSASVTLTLRQDPVGPMTVSVKVDPSVAAANDLAGTVPGLSKAFPVEASGTFDATGQNIVDTAATGTVTFTNLNNFVAVPVIAGTRVTTAGGVAFTTTSTVNVPKATTSVDLRLTPGKADAPVQAVVNGTSGNVAAGTIVKLPSDLATYQVSVSNKAATSGGSHTVTPKIVQSDIDAAEASLFSQLDAQFQTALQSPGAAPSGSSLFAESAHLGVAICNPDPAGLVEQAAASFQLDCTSTGTATTAETTSIRDLAARRIHSVVRTGYSLVESSVTTNVGAPTAQGADVVVPVIARALEVPVVEVAQLRAGIKGKSLDEARAFLSQYGQADISVSPDWASTMPSFDFRIDIEVVLPSAQGSGGPSPSGSPGATIPGASAPPAGGPGTGTAATSPSPTAAVSPTPGVSESSPPGGSPSPSTSPAATSSASPGASPTPSPTPSPSPS